MSLTKSYRGLFRDHNARLLGNGNIAKGDLIYSSIGVHCMVFLVVFNTFCVSLTLTQTVLQDFVKDLSIDYNSNLEL